MNPRLRTGAAALLGALAILGSSCGQGLAPALPGESAAPPAAVQGQSEPGNDPARLAFGLDGYDPLGWYADWLQRHQPVSHGENWLKPDQYLSASPGTEILSFSAAKPRPLLPAAGEGASFLMYGVRDVPGPDVLRRIRATLHFDERDLDTAQVMLGYANYDSGRFQISVPFTPEEEISMRNLWADNVNDGGRGYILVIVTGTQHPAQLWTLGVEFAPPGSAL